MSDHHATVRWTRGDQPFTDVRYSRAHAWTFDGGASVCASSSPAHVPVPLSDPAAVDPEEAFVAALASCHMLVFLHLTATRGLTVDEYEDTPSGQVTPVPGARGRLTLSRVVLSPRVRFAPGMAPGRAALLDLHHEAHEGCFLAGALAIPLVVEPRLDAEEG